MKNMTRQELAVALYKIDWMKVQVDDVEENTRLQYLEEQLNKLPQREAIPLLLEVYEARTIHLKYPEVSVAPDSTFVDMHKFEGLRNRGLVIEDESEAAEDSGGMKRKDGYLWGVLILSALLIVISMFSEGLWNPQWLWWWYLPALAPVAFINMFFRKSRIGMWLREEV